MPPGGGDSARGPSAKPPSAGAPGRTAHTKSRGDIGMPFFGDDVCKRLPNGSRDPQRASAGLAAPTVIA